MKMENEKLIERFLFGELPEQERFDLEEKFITDADFFEQIKSVEDELIEKYVRRWMNPAERSKFEQNFLISNKRRERVEFSRQFIKKIEEQKESVAIPVEKNENEIAENISVWDKIAAFILTPKIAMAGALALIIGVFGSWVLYQNFNSVNKSIVKNENSESVETPMATISAKPVDLSNNQNNNQKTSSNLDSDSQSNTDNLNGNTNKTPQKMPTQKKTTEKIKKTTSPAKTPPINKTAPNPILALFGGTVRSEGKNNVLKFPKEAKSATLQLNLESVDYKYFQAELTDADGNVLFQRSNLITRKKRINFNIPAEKLKRGDYIIKLYGKNDATENESVADFQFRVNR